jgi:hypothetical protein
MRLTAMEHIGQIKQQYLNLRSKGACRTEATGCVIRDFEAQSAQERLTFWIGLADAQYFRKELCISVALQALLALHRLGEYGIDFTPGDIERRRRNYALAPMKERKLGRPRKKA